MAIIDVVRNEGERGLMAWKHPSQELGSWSQLLVNEGEEAVLFALDRAADCFATGRHTLETANLPLLGNLLRLPFGGKSPFTAELWFVNTGKTLDIKWGTDSPILLSNSGEQCPLLMRGYGLLGVRVTDSRLFLSSLRGRVSGFDERSLAAYLRGQLCEVVRESIAGCLRQHGGDFCEKEEAHKLLSEQLKLNAVPALKRYGLSPACLIVSDLCLTPQDGSDERHMTFSITSVVIPPPISPQAPNPPAPEPERRRTPIVAAAFVLLLLLLVVFVVLLPPRQTTDFAGIAFAVAAHCLVTTVAIRLFTVRRGLLVTVGFGATAALYWLGAVGTALVFRLLSIVGTGLLTALELGMTGVAALALMGFWYGRVYDRARCDKEAAGDEQQA